MAIPATACAGIALAVLLIPLIGGGGALALGVAVALAGWQRGGPAGASLAALSVVASGLLLLVLGQPLVTLARELAAPALSLLLLGAAAGWASDQRATLRAQLEQQQARCAEVEAQRLACSQEEASLRASVERLRVLMRSTNDAFWDWELASDQLSWNEGLQRLFGFSEAEVEPTSLWWERRIHPDDRTHVLASLYHVIASGPDHWASEYRFRRQDGSYAYVSDRGTVMRDGQGMAIRLLGAMNDITARKEAEQHLRESEASFRLLAENAEDLIYRYRVTPFRAVEYISPSVSQMLGYAPEEHYADPTLLFKLIYPEDRRLFETAAQSAVAIREPLTLRWIRKDGTIIWMEQRNVPVYGHDGQWIAVEGIARNINERKWVEEALRQSEERSRTIFEAAPIGMALVSLDGQLLKVNRALSSLLGYPTHLLLTLSLQEIAHPEDREKIERHAQQIQAGGGPPPSIELRYLTRGGELLWAKLAMSIVKGQEGIPLYQLAMIEDITQIKRAELLEDQQRHIAYEIHDGLAQVLLGAHQHLQAFAYRYRTRSPEARKDLDRAIELVQRTVTEARRMIDGLRPTALDDFGLAHAIRLHVEALQEEGWEIDYQDQLGATRLNPQQEIALFRVIQEALTNIRRHAHTQRARILLANTGSGVQLEVQDWGRGFDPARRPASRGPGERVGLRGMQDRVAMLGGTLTISSELGAGTQITAQIPLGSAEKERL